jgi:hypothetical protein
VITSSPIGFALRCLVIRRSCCIAHALSVAAPSVARGSLTVMGVGFASVRQDCVTRGECNVARLAPRAGAKCGTSSATGAARSHRGVAMS